MLGFLKYKIKYEYDTIVMVEILILLGSFHIDNLTPKCLHVGHPEMALKVPF